MSTYYAGLISNLQNHALKFVNAGWWTLAPAKDSGPGRDTGRRKDDGFNNNAARSATDATKRDAVMAFVVRVASTAIVFLSQIVLVRTMGDTNFGIFTTVWIWVIVLGRTGCLGFGESVIRFLPRYLERGNHGSASHFLRTSRLVVLGASSALAAAMAASVWMFAPHIATPYTVPLVLAAICLPLFAAQDLYEGIARAMGWNVLALVPVYVLRPLLIIAGFGVLLLAGVPATVESALIASIIALTTSLILQAVIVEIRLHRLLPATQTRTRSTSHWIKASVPLFLVYWFEELLTYSDIILLSAFVPPADIAVYFVATKTLALAAFVRYAIAIVVGRQFSVLNIKGDQQALQSFASATTKWTFLPTVGALAVVLTIGYPVLLVFGPQYTSGMALLFVLGAGIGVRAAFGQAEDLLIMLGHQTINLWIAGVSLILNICLNLVLIPLFGLVGAAAATSLVVVLRSILLAVAAKHLTGIDTILKPKELI